MTTQITMSPYYGTPDFSPLTSQATTAPVDLVSVADLLRNAFVYPPFSILQGVRLVTFGFCPRDDMHQAPEFRFKFRNAGEVPEVASSEQDWVAGYHRLLCDSIRRSCAGMHAPWLLQSGGKDSTTLAIAIAEARPDTTCITYLGGREENEVDSAAKVARTLGLRHETLVCDPGRAYDRYLAVVDRMPLLTADFALLSCVDLGTEVAATGGDGIIDGLGADSYFGTPMSRRQHLLARLAQDINLSPRIAELPLVDRSFRLCYLLSTLQMNPIERVFPGSRFSDEEVDELFGRKIATHSRQRLELFLDEIGSATTPAEWRDMSTSIAGSAGAFAKGLYTASALSLQAAYPFCDLTLREWIHREVPRYEKVDPKTQMNKLLIRQHIATRFGDLPYVQSKGSFRFDLRGLAQQRFDHVLDLARRSSDLLPGAGTWLERNRQRLDNKYHASKFYLLAIVLPWLESRRQAALQSVDGIHPGVANVAQH
ncbi:asparagine synthase-related protein [Lysobacter sp. S4-A87]|uniref:asparagine synthase-related protein n=1 Tax=Lysobacter sp. S4-A87 TaxID=2925843 RepID=UPI001F530453|nr:asparagine synthase-related protein [Lysobacter sp. S4-A87]UNK49944.1 asparagine synthase-related protein [Lysobacter sp. S4-A87]